MTQAKLRFKSIQEYMDYDDDMDRRYELIDGVLVEMPAESDLNVMIAGFLFSVLLQFVPHYLLRRGTELEVSSRTVSSRYPDLMVLTEATLALLEGARRSIVLLAMPAPRLIVEVVSPGLPGDQKNYERDYIDKRQEYAARGISEYWLIDPQHQIVLVLTLVGAVYQEKSFTGQALIVSPTFPGLHLTAAQMLRAGR